MEVEIDGIVIDEPKNPMKYCIYVVRSRGKEYMIVSYHVQAVKDYIFIKVGQHVHITGEEISDGIIEEKKSRIIFDLEIKNLKRNN